MKGVLIVAAVLSLPSASRGGEEVRSSGARAALAQKVKQAFPYEPTASKMKEEQAEPDGPVVIMARFTVVEPAPLRGLQEKMDAEREKKKAEELSWIKGGALVRQDLKNVRIEFGPMGDGARLNILRISW